MFGPPENVHLPDGPVCGWTVWPLCHAAGSGQGTFRARIQRLVEKRSLGFVTCTVVAFTLSDQAIPVSHRHCLSHPISGS